MTPKSFYLACALSVVAGSIASPTFADAVLVFDRETTGALRQPRRSQDDVGAPQAAPDTKQAVTVSLQGTKARVEFRPAGAAPDAAPSKVLLYDGTAQKVYTLDVAAKTFYAQSYKEAIDGERKARDGGGNRMSFDASVDVKAARASNAYVSKTVGDVSTRQYLLSGTATMKFDMPSGGMGGGMPGGGGFPGSGGGRMPGGGGGFPGGGIPGGGQGAPGGGFTPPSLSVSGEVWSADGTALFAAGRDTPVVAVYRLMIPDNAGPFGASLTKPVVAKLKSLKGLPAESSLSLRMSSRFQESESGAAPQDAPLTTHLTLKTQKTDATLGAELFAVPADYKAVDVPAPDFGRGGGGRGFRGRRGTGGSTTERNTGN